MMPAEGNLLSEILDHMLTVKSLVAHVEKMLKNAQMPSIDEESLEDKIESLSDDARKALKQAISDKEVQKVFSILGFKVGGSGVRTE